MDQLSVHVLINPYAVRCEMADRLHELGGRGYGSRFRVSASELPPGWRQARRSGKYTIWYDSTGKCYKSSHKVESALQNFCVCNAREFTVRILLLSANCLHVYHSNEADYSIT